MIEVVLYENNAVMGSLEVTDSGSFPLALTKSNSDIRDITKRQGAYSKDFEVLATVNNNRVLKYIYNANTTPIGFRDCAILSNGMPILEGKIFVTGIKQREAAEVYSLRVYSDNVDWYVLMRDKSIKDYDYGNTETPAFTELNGTAQTPLGASTNSTVYSSRWINGTWLFPDNFDYVYPLVSYGQPDLALSVTVNDMRPAIYLGKMLTKAFADVGYTMSSDFFSTGIGSRLILPYTQDNFRQDGLVATNNSFQVQGSTSIASNVLFLQTIRTLVHSGAVTNPNLVYNTTTGVYTVTFASNYTFTAKGKFTINFPTAIDRVRLGLVAFTVSLNGVTVVPTYNNIPVNQQSIDVNVGQTIEFEYDFTTATIYRAQGATGQVAVLINITTCTEYFSQIARPFNIGWQSVINDSFTATASPVIVEGQSYQIANTLQDIKVLDILSGLQNMFNLYFDTSNYGRTVTIEPKKDLIKLPSQGIDYRQKLDINNRINTKLVDNYNRYLNFQFKEDSNDGWQKNFNSENGSIYGSVQYDLGDEFKDGSTTVGTNFFSATVIYDKHPFSPNGCPIPVLWKDNAPSPPKYYDFAPRVLYYKGLDTITQANGVLANWQWLNSANNLHTLIPSAFMLDPDTAETTPVNILYGDKTNANGLARTYYNGDVAIIADRRVHTAYFRLTPTEFSNIDLFAPIYIDHVNLEGWYYINQVVDFKPEGNVTTVFELVKAFNELPFSRPIATEIPTIQGGRRQLSAMGGGTLTAGVKETFGSVVAHNGSGNVGIIGGGGTVLGNGNKQTASNQSILGNFNYGNDAIFTVGVGLDDDLRYNGLQFMPDGRVLAHGGNIYIRRYPTGAIELIDLKVRMTVNGSTVLDNIHLIGRNG